MRNVRKRPSSPPRCPPCLLLKRKSVEKFIIASKSKRQSSKKKCLRDEKETKKPNQVHPHLAALFVSSHGANSSKKESTPGKVNKNQKRLVWRQTVTKRLNQLPSIPRLIEREQSRSSFGNHERLRAQNNKSEETKTTKKDKKASSTPSRPSPPRSSLQFYGAKQARTKPKTHVKGVLTIILTQREGKIHSLQAC